MPQCVLSFEREWSPWDDLMVEDFSSGQVYDSGQNHESDQMNGRGQVGTTECAGVVGFDESLSPEMRSLLTEIEETGADGVEDNTSLAKRSL